MMTPDRLLYCACCDTHDFDADDYPVLGPAARPQVRLLTQWLGPILRFQPLAGINQVPNRMPALSLAGVAVPPERRELSPAAGAEAWNIHHCRMHRSSVFQGLGQADVRQDGV